MGGECEYDHDCDHQLACLTSSVAILASAPAASLLSARFVTTDPSAVVPKVTQETLLQLASVGLWLVQNNRDQKQNQGASLSQDNSTVLMAARGRFSRPLLGEEAV